MTGYSQSDLNLCITSFVEDLTLLCQKNRGRGYHPTITKSDLLLTQFPWTGDLVEKIIRSCDNPSIFKGWFYDEAKRHLDCPLSSQDLGQFRVIFCALISSAAMKKIIRIRESFLWKESHWIEGVESNSPLKHLFNPLGVQFLFHRTALNREKGENAGVELWDSVSAKSINYKTLNRTCLLLADMVCCYGVSTPK